MPSWKKVIVSGSDASLNSINVATNVVAQSFSGSLFGTASYATQALSASYTTTASYADFASTSSNVQGGTQFYVPLWNTNTSLTSSYLNQSGSVLKTIYNGTDRGLTLDYNFNSFILGNPGVGNNTYLQVFDGGSVINIYSPNYTYFNDKVGVRIIPTNPGLAVSGALEITGPSISKFMNSDVQITGSLSVTGGITGSLLGTASFASSALSSSYAVTASYADFAVSSSQATSASFAVTASFSNTSTSASFATNALTASYALFAANGGGGGGGATVTHTQLTASTTWSFGHNLNTLTPLLQVYDLNYEQIIPNEIVSINSFISEIRFDYTQAGYAVASTGGGLTVTGSTPRLTQTIPATTWSFAHNLGTQYPGFEVFDQNDYVIIPAGIYAIDENNAEIYFATPSTGVAIANFSGIDGVVPVATSASYATTASYAFFAETASYATNIVISGSINNVDYIDFDTNVAYTLAEGRLGWDSGDSNLQLGLEGGNVQYSLGEQIYQYCFNAETSSLSKGQVVFISGSQGNRIAVKLADNSGDPTSAGTLGFVAETITAGGTGWVITEGNLRKLNTIGLTAGSLLYLGSTPGTYTQTKPVAPRHEVRLGYVERVHASVGSIYVKIDNGYEIGELHDVVDNTTTASYGDLLVKSGSVWHDSRQLTGSYGLTGSLQATSFTGSLLGTASFATHAATSSYSDQFHIGGTQTQYALITSSINGSNIVFNVATGSYSSAFFKYTVTSGSNARSGEIMSVWNGSTATFTDNSTTDIGTTTAVTSSVALSGANIQLDMQTNTAGWRIKSIATFM